MAKKKREAAVTEEVVVTEPVKEVAEVKVEPKKVSRGVVSGCVRLNVRCNPKIDAAVVNVINNGAELKIVEDVGDWYSVVTASGTKGFCLKEYVKAEE